MTAGRLTLVSALSDPLPCVCLCHELLSEAQRARGIATLFRLDDILRGWGYQPLYEPWSTELFRQAQIADGAADRRIAVREHACLYGRLVGFCLHEIIHALCGEAGQPNHGIPFGLPYCVPESVPPAEEAAYLAPHNFAEARAFTGVGILARAWFAIDWAVYTARDVGTYGFAGGNAIVPPKAPGYRAVPHVDHQHHPQRYQALARRLEAEAARWFTPENLAGWWARVEEAERAGQKLRAKPWPDPASLARMKPRPPRRNDPCVCGSGSKWKACHGG